MRKQLSIIFLVVALILTAAIYFGIRRTEPKNSKIKVTTDFYVLAEFARQVGDGRVDIAAITPSGVEPHDFEPTPKQIRQVFSSKVFLFNGADFAPWAEKTGKQTRERGIITRNLSDSVTLRKTKQNSRKSPDPHFWLDPVLAQKEIRTIRDALVEADPSGIETYDGNAAIYIAKLKKLDRDYREGLKSYRNREVVSSHAAFGYLALRYDLKVLPIVVSPNEEPSPRRIGEIARLVKERNIKYIFFETLADPKVAKTIAREAGAKTLVFNPIEALTAEEAAAGEDYISLMRENLRVLRLALEN